MRICYGSRVGLLIVTEPYVKMPDSSYHARWLHPTRVYSITRSMPEDMSAGLYATMTINKKRGSYGEPES